MGYFVHVKLSWNWAEARLIIFLMFIHLKPGTFHQFGRRHTIHSTNLILDSWRVSTSPFLRHCTGVQLYTYSCRQAGLQASASQAETPSPAAIRHPYSATERFRQKLKTASITSKQVLFLQTPLQPGYSVGDDSGYTRSVSDSCQ